MLCIIEKFKFGTKTKIPPKIFNGWNVKMQLINTYQKQIPHVIIIINPVTKTGLNTVGGT